MRNTQQTPTSIFILLFSWVWGKGIPDFTIVDLKFDIINCPTKI